MKHRFFLFLLCAALLWTLCPAAIAADGTSGFYNVGRHARIAIAPVTDDGQAIAAVQTDADGDGKDDSFYPGSRALTVTVSGTSPSAFYFLTVSSSGRTFYADQKLGGGDLCFRVSFALPDARTEFFLEVASTEAGFEKAAVPLAYAPSASAITFSDVDKGAWYYESVQQAVETGLMNGLGDGSFHPNGTTSRAMIVTMLWRMEGSPIANYAMSFTDVSSGAWYAEAVRWAASEQIAAGYADGTFKPDGAITREQFAALLYRCAQRKGKGFTGAWMFRPDFPDAAEVSGWASEAVHWCVMHGVLNGKDGKLVPGGSATRAEAAAMLLRSSAVLAS